MKIEDRYKLDARIGEGAQSVVYVGTCRLSGAVVAVKEIKSTGTSHREDVIPITKLAANFREVAVLQRLREAGSHPNIVELIEVVFDPNTVYIVMSHCGMNLSEFIARCRSRLVDSIFGLRTPPLEKPVVPIDNIRSVMFQVVSAVEFAHSQLVMHRDLKPQNIFISFNEYGKIVAKVGDFGLAKAYTVPLAPETINVASLWYRAPEVLLQSGYDLGIDLWSLGCVLAEMATGKPLFIESSEFGVMIKIFQTLGTPSEQEWAVLGRSQNFSTKWPKWDRKDCLARLSSYMGKLLGKSGSDLQQKFLYYESNQRLRTADALKHEFFIRYEEIPGDISDGLSDLSV